jgi:hypothetical protein
MTSKLTIALVLLLTASSAASAAHRHYRYYGPHYGPSFGYGSWHHSYRGTLPNDTTRSFDYQMDMGQWSGKINAR